GCPVRIRVGAGDEPDAFVTRQARDVLTGDGAAADTPDPEWRRPHRARNCRLRSRASRMSVAHESNSTIHRSIPAAAAAAIEPARSTLPPPRATVGAPRRPVPA